MAFNEKTVLVVGAGAHAEYGMPLAGELMEAVIRRAWPPAGDTSYFEIEEMRGGRGSINGDMLAGDIDGFVRPLKRAAADSLDQYVEDTRGTKLIGGIVIAGYLLAYEAHVARQPAMHEKGRLYTRLFQAARPRGGFGAHGGPDYGNLSIVTFNYDRICELALHNFATTRDLPGCNSNRLNPAVLPRIVHVYGSLDSEIVFDPQAEVPTLVPRATGNAVERSSKSILLAADRKGSTEDGTGLPGSVVESQSLLDEASTIVFLGFSFNRTNLELLGFDGTERARARFESKRICGTCYGMSQRSIREAEKALGRTPAWFECKAAEALDQLGLI